MSQHTSTTTVSSYEHDNCTQLTLVEIQTIISIDITNVSSKNGTTITTIDMTNLNRDNMCITSGNTTTTFTIYYLYYYLLSVLSYHIFKLLLLP